MAYNIKTVPKNPSEIIAINFKLPIFQLKFSSNLIVMIHLNNIYSYC